MNKVIGIALASMLVAATAQAGDKMDKTTEMLNSEENFAALDADQNGAISQKEAAADSTLVKSFANVDVDQDGAISQKEYILHAGEATAAGQ